MNIIILCKRRPQSRDLFSRPSGRFYFIPQALANKGHEVHLVLLNYKIEREFNVLRNNIHWHSVNLLPNLVHYYFYAKKLSLEFKADYVIGFSDIIFGIYAQEISKKTNCLSVIDAYDNYESYIPWLKPLHWLWRNSLKKANIITAAGPELLSKLSSGLHDRDRSRAVVEMAADPIFIQGSQSKSRKKLGLPENKFIIGYSGSLAKNRGVSIMLDAFSEVSSIYPNVIFVFSGRLENGIDLSKLKNKILLGYVNDNIVPDVLRSFNLLVSVNKKSSFGNFSYPVKIYEALAVGVPVIATKTLSTSYVLRDYPQALFEAGNVSFIVEKLTSFIEKSYDVKTNNYGWSEKTRIFEELLLNYKKDELLN